MKNIAVIAAAALCLAVSAPAMAAPHGGHGPHGGPRIHHPAPPPHHYHGHRYHRDHYYWPLGVGAVALTAAVLAASAANSSSSTTVVTAPPAPTLQPPAPVTIGQPQSAPAAEYFYCPAANGYYPTVPTCPEGWVKISPVQ